jgi:hypothetical protein
MEFSHFSYRTRDPTALPKLKNGHQRLLSAELLPHLKVLRRSLKQIVKSHPVENSYHTIQCFEGISSFSFVMSITA